ncbi:hypothetical protein NIES2100_29690 [Calothrix sp. NIES-2100]|uniref:hypothetical protein n=1 Tax=Calothrix sp. NIES-2100 TaxID=1954172 RepID=UPI000B5F41EB|nr:hypothetical protein NIES2100_29690 [Calothrix sp. NIES-2100]
MPETIVQQSQKSLKNLPVLHQPINLKIIQPNPIQESIQLWANICDKKTIEVYQQAAGKTWDLFKQAISVILFLCKLLIALIIWVSGIAFQMGQIFRNKLEVEQPNLEQIISTLLEFFLWPVARVYDWAASFIKQYLGWDNPLTEKASAIQSEKTDSASGASIESSSAN